MVICYSSNRKLIHPVYFPKDQCQYIPEVACEWPEETGEIPWYDL